MIIRSEGDVMEESKYIYLSHNASNLVYHIVCPAKYRRVVFEETVDEHLKQICLGIELRYDYISFLEIGTDKDYVHFLVQSTPNYSPSQIVKIIKSITARQIFSECPEVKKKLWGGQFWTDGYFVATVGKNQNETVIREYVKNQGKQDTEYKQLYMSFKDITQKDTPQLAAGSFIINHEILFEKLSKEFDDKDILNILKEIISSTDNLNVNKSIDKIIADEISKLEKKNISDLEKKKTELFRLPRYQKGVGLPIGNETSQILAVYYLNGLDHFIKEKLRIKCYIRYMDDFILFHHDKEYLKFCLKKIEEYLKGLKLSLNKKTQIYDMKKGFNFLGYKFFLKEKKLIIIINNQTKKRIKKKLKRLKKNNFSKYTLVRASYKGYFMSADTGVSRKVCK